MKFKIKPFREKKINALLLCLIFTFLPLILLGIFVLISRRYDLCILLCIWFLISCILSLFILGEIQWYCIEEEKIVVKNYLGVVNEVYFCEVQKIVDIELSIVRYKYTRCFIFIDKEKKIDDKVFWGTVHNSKLNFVRVPVTNELIELLEELNLTEKLYIPKKLY